MLRAARRREGPGRIFASLTALGPARVPAASPQDHSRDDASSSQVFAGSETPFSSFAGSRDLAVARTVWTLPPPPLYRSES